MFPDISHFGTLQFTELSTLQFTEVISSSAPCHPRCLLLQSNLTVFCIQLQFFSQHHNHLAEWTAMSSLQVVSFRQIKVIVTCNKYGTST